MLCIFGYVGVPDHFDKNSRNTLVLLLIGSTFSDKKIMKAVLAVLGDSEVGSIPKTNVAVSVANNFIQSQSADFG